jgi:hypothetical protein
MKLVLAAVAVVIAAGCSSGGARSSWTAHPDGRIGPLAIDISTDADVRDFAGLPDKVERDVFPGVRGHTLIYRCGRHCETDYSINDRTGRLSDYWTTSPRFRTERGSSPGMTAVRAARLEHRKPRPGCGFPRYLYLLATDHPAKRLFVLAIWKGKIDSIGYLGPHSVYYDGLC